MARQLVITHTRIYYRYNLGKRNSIIQNISMLSAIPFDYTEMSNVIYDFRYHYISVFVLCRFIQKAPKCTL